MKPAVSSQVSTVCLKANSKHSLGRGGGAVAGMALALRAHSSPDLCPPPVGGWGGAESGLTSC